MDSAAVTTDHELMRLCHSGSAAAFAELVRRWNAPLGRLLGQLLGSQTEVDDLCQEVFVRVLQASGRYQPSHAFSTWIYRIALNVARDRRRRDRRRPAAQTVPRDLVAATPTPADMLARNETQSAVSAAVAALPEELREVLVLKHFGKLSLSEIAQATGIPLGTTKSRLQTAIKQLYRELKKRGIHEAD